MVYIIEGAGVGGSRWAPPLEGNIVHTISRVLCMEAMKKNDWNNE